jgi:alanine racemase
METPSPTARLTIDTAALVANWRSLAAAAHGADCGAAIKADGYGLGAVAVMTALAKAGTRDFFVAHWQEVTALGRLPPGVRLAVLHGFSADQLAAALASPAIPVLNTPAQVQAWRSTGRPCDVMVDTGMNRLGLSPAEALSGLLDGLPIDTLHSHLACAETPGDPRNEHQRAAFADIAALVPARRFALANTGGIGLGAGYRFGLVRPGIGLFGGGAGANAGDLRPVAGLSAQILQIRHVEPGACVGYGATFTARRPTRLATVAIGYADGYPRALSDPPVAAAALVAGVRCPLAGRISMDLASFDVTDAPPLAEGDWIDLDFNLARTAAASGRTQYELLTGLGRRYARVYR